MINGIGNNFYQTERPNQKMDPNSYAQQYATQNNMSVDDAKSSLKSQFGDPQAQDSGSIFTQQGMGSEEGASSAAQPQEENQNGGDASIAEILKMLMSLLGGQGQGESQSAAQ